jgi:hypothetical protein
MVRESLGGDHILGLAAIGGTRHRSDIPELVRGFQGMERRAYDVLNMGLHLDQGGYWHDLSPFSYFS